MLSVVRNPFFPQDLASKLSESQRVTEFFFTLKRMGRGSEANHGLARIQECGDVFCLLSIRAAESSGDDHQVSGIQCLQSSQALLVVAVDVFRSIGTECKDRRAFEAVLLAENFSQHRHHFFGAIFFIAGDQHHMFRIGPCLRRFEYERVAGTRCAVEKLRGRHNCRGENQHS